MYLKELDTLRAGDDPKGTIRDKSKNQIIVIPAYERWVSAAERKEMEEAPAR